MTSPESPNRSLESEIDTLQRNLRELQKAEAEGQDHAGTIEAIEAELLRLNRELRMCTVNKDGEV